MVPKSNVIFFYTFLMALIISLNAHGNQEDGEFAGDETCMECHEEIYQDFWQSPHGISGDLRSPAGRNEGFACESCHGPTPKRVKAAI
jgi:hypothetical protein